MAIAEARAPIILYSRSLNPLLLQPEGQVEVLNPFRGQLPASAAIVLPILACRLVAALARRDTIHLPNKSQ